MLYQPKERLVYDPEVKRLLERIEKRLKPDAEEMLRLLESSPELYDLISGRLLEKMNEDFHKQLEANKPTEEEDKKEPQEEVKDVKTEVEAKEDELGTEAEKLASEILGEGSSETLSQEELAQQEELLAEQTQDAEAPHNIEPPINVLSSEPKIDVIEQIEAQDLSSLENELYQEPLEPEVPTGVGAEPLEPLRSDVEAELEIEREMMDDPAFPDSVERFKKPTPRLEPEFNEYGC